MFDASRLAEVMLGDTIYSNMLILGAAWQAGAVPLTRDAILKAVELNGAKVPQNQRAFEIGRWAVLEPEEAAKRTASIEVDKPQTLQEKIDFRSRHLVAYQGKRLAKRYGKRLEASEDADVKAAMADGYHKLLAYKDEYEVARLLRGTQAKVAEVFEGEYGIKHHLAPPMISKVGPDGRPAKREMGGGMFGVLARLKWLRGTWFDPFGRTEERRLERALIREYEADMDAVLPLLTDQTREAVVALARLPLDIRGFGPVKLAKAKTAAKRRAELLAVIRAGGVPVRQAAE